MCGIVGYVGPKEVFPILVGGLKKLEYRGYDSAGVASVEGGKFQVFRSEGKLSKLQALLAEQPAAEKGKKGHLSLGIGHTRWATHGRPSETNAHPHVAGRVCVVHNGIIENYLSLKAKLLKANCAFSSETDTEIAAHLINQHMLAQGNKPSLLKAVRGAVRELEGSYALVVISLDEPDRLVVAKNSTPIIIGLAENEKFVASGIPAMLEHTREMIILEDGDIAEITADKVSIERDEEPITREVTTITWDPITAEKGGFRHFMLKEIHEQPQVVTDTVRGRLDYDAGTVFLEGIDLESENLKQIERIVIVACGTAWHAGLITKFYLEKFARIPVEVDYASEYRYRDPIVDGKTLCLAISQSGETADTLNSFVYAKGHGAKTLSICNVIGSAITRKSDAVLYTHAGPEMSVASTKAFLTQLTAGYLLALGLGRARGHLSPEDARVRFDELLHLPALLSQALTLDKQIEKVARKYGKGKDFLYLGRGFLYPVALEGALKLKEISYLHAEGYPAGEMKHGPIALISEETPVIVIIGHDGVNYEKAMSNLKEVESRGGRIIAVTDEATDGLKEVAWELIEVGKVPPLLLPMVLTLPLQLLAYHVAVYNGTDVDQPRNLAKSVTVE